MGTERSDAIRQSDINVNMPKREKFLQLIWSAGR